MSTNVQNNALLMVFLVNAYAGAVPRCWGWVCRREEEIGLQAPFKSDFFKSVNCKIRREGIK